MFYQIYTACLLWHMYMLHIIYMLYISVAEAIAVNEADKHLCPSAVPA